MRGIKFLIIATIAIFWVAILGLGVSADTTLGLYPVADGGEDSTLWLNTSSTACNTTDCYTEVNETTGGDCTNSDGDTSYIEAAVNGASQTFDLDISSIPDTATITQIDITVCYTKGEAQKNDFQTRYCIDGNCFNSGIDLRTGNSYAQDTQSFSSLSILKSALSDIEIGTYISGTGNKMVRISQISALFNYTDVVPPVAISDLVASDPGTSSVKLTWTSPGDDGSSGTATSYDIRYSESLITVANWGSATQVINNPTPDSSGASETFYINDVLDPDTNYFFAIKTSDEIPNESGLSNVPSIQTLEGSSGELLRKLSPRTVIFSGQAYPGSEIELFRKSIEDPLYGIIPTTVALINEDGAFKVEYTDIIGADHFFALQFQDKDKRETGILAYNLDLTTKLSVIEVKDIFIPPTVGFEKSIINIGQDLKVVGYAAPNSQIEFEIDDILTGESISDNNGYWHAIIDTKDLGLDSYAVKARQVLSSEQISDYSFPRSFRISEELESLADFNNDGQVSIIDFSIFMFNWSSESDQINTEIDLDRNGIIDLSDLSIFLQALQI